SPGERLDCYEKQVARATAAAPASQPPAAAQSERPVAAPSQRPAAPAAPTAAARNERPVAAPSEPPAARPRDRAVRTEEARVPNGSTESNGKVTAGISALRETIPNAWLITLDNGQVWRQDYPEPYPLKVGQRVEIATSGRLSGVRLTAAGLRGSIQVERVR
ncbi:MAG TPA: hypothetical protein VM692_07565, partial [Gammaproteobacteria bacterium]|nr:hypothetical protein [Gammaproteobacteria bacterium]